MRRSAWLAAWLLAGLTTWPAAAALAQSVAAPLPASAEPPQSMAPPIDIHASKAPDNACVNAQQGGAHTLSYDCLNQKLEPTPGVSAGGDPADAAAALARGPSNRVGTFNATAEHNRFGSNWGKSVLPQRPPRVVMPSLR